MFNIIIVVISIILVGLLTGAAVYYGGKAFTDGNAKSEANRIVIEAQQITGAVVAYNVRESSNLTFSTDCQTNGTNCFTDLIDRGYLTASPRSKEKEWKAVDLDGNGSPDTLLRAGLEIKQCAMVNFVAGAITEEVAKKAGPEAIPVCNDSGNGAYVCCCSGSDCPVPTP